MIKSRAFRATVQRTKAKEYNNTESQTQGVLKHNPFNPKGQSPFITGAQLSLTQLLVTTNYK